MSAPVTTTSLAIQTSQPQVRVRVFVDFWNFSLSIKRQDASFQTNWAGLGPLFVAQAASLIGAPAAFEAMHVYGSTDPTKAGDVKLRNWFTNWLDKQPGTHVVLLERQKKKGYPKCPHCQTETATCYHCGGDMRGTEEKGVDTRMVADMISLAWADAYDVAVLVSSDRDFVPVAEFLQTKGVKVLHGAFPPNGSQLSQKCWGSIDITKMMTSFKR